MKFNKYPTIKAGAGEDCIVGWSKIRLALKSAVDTIDKADKIVAIECYQGVFLDEISNEIEQAFPEANMVYSASAMKDERTIRDMTQPDVTDDRVFGVMTSLCMHHFFDAAKLERDQGQIRSANGLTVVVGIGASLFAAKWDLLIYADMARWEIQQRMRKNTVDNIGINDRAESIENQYKRAYFVDWRVCDQLKRELMSNWDFVLDTNDTNEVKLAKGKVILDALGQAVKQPFSVVPFFDPGPWGGQWMKKKFELDEHQENFAWCFNCVPEENSLLIEFPNTTFEIPSLNVVFYHPKELLGEEVYQQFGAEFPIRFDFLDTMDGGNLSLQVHPLSAYIKEQFDMDYTQDESYYMLDAGKDAFVYLGVNDGVDKEEMIAELKKSQSNGHHFDADKYATKWPAKKHDHFLIPAGTVHCSGKDCMVLEISATPYIFTFKLWDWGRLGMDGKPRPISIDHGKNVIQWDRTPSWTKENLINRFETYGQGNGWQEEKTGLHELEFIETRRHWFDQKISHHSGNTLNVLMLVEGDEALVECPRHTFEAFHVNYAEAFIIPASVKEYTITPTGASKGKKIATIKAFVKKQDRT
ncbi:MAG: class I mannose-6-phosphate isomerase [Reichenbachiella sp.]|uniref:class I mannose-6-phosphate isomerase n=1 Tax=Reichenbachiella sp. TaxID=2184521 RepID=UPI0032634D5B